MTSNMMNEELRANGLYNLRKKNFNIISSLIERKKNHGKLLEVGSAH